jgi:hypothetical protein
MKILMHMCCARCAAYPISKLMEEGNEVFGLYYNPNIHTDVEFEKRADSVIKFSEIKGFNVFYYPDLVVEVDSLEELDLTRYDLRIKRTFELGKDLGYDAVSTSLLASPNLDHDKILEIGHKYSKMFDIPFYDEDFREGFLEGQKMIEKLGLY